MLAGTAESVSEGVSGEPEETLTHAERKPNARERKTCVNRVKERKMTP